MLQLSIRNNLLRARQYRRGRMWQRASPSFLNPTAALNLPRLNFTSPALLPRPRARNVSLSSLSRSFSRWRAPSLQLLQPAKLEAFSGRFDDN